MGGTIEMHSLSVSPVQSVAANAGFRCLTRNRGTPLLCEAMLSWSPFSYLASNQEFKKTEDLYIYYQLNDGHLPSSARSQVILRCIFVLYSSFHSVHPLYLNQT